MKKLGNFTENVLSRNEMRFINGGNVNCVAVFRNSSGNKISSEPMGGNCSGWSNCAPNGTDIIESSCNCF